MLHLRTETGYSEYQEVRWERRTTPPGALWPASPWDISPPTNGQVGQGIGGAQSERRVRSIGAVYACCSVLYDGVATLPLRQFKGTGPTRQEIDLSPVIYDPWPEVTDMDFRGMGTYGLALRGNFIGRIVGRDRKANPTMVQPLDNDFIQVKRGKSGQLEYWVTGESAPIDPDDVFHIRNITRPGNVLGMGPVEELRMAWALAAGADGYAASFFTNGALPQGIITVGEDLSEEETLAMRDAWLQMHQGSQNANLPAVLTGGAEWHQISMNLEDAQFIQSRQLSWSEISMIFRIPPHMIAVVDKTTSWGTGIEQQETGFVRNTLGGYIRRWELALSRLLPGDQHVEFDLRRRLRGDSVQRAAVIVSLVNAGVIHRNEARTLFEDMPLGPDALNTFLQPMNMGDAGMFQPPILPKGSNAPLVGPSSPMPLDSGTRSYAELESVVDEVQRLLALRDIRVPELTA